MPTCCIINTHHARYNILHEILTAWKYTAWNCCTHSHATHPVGLLCYGMVHVRSCADLNHFDNRGSSPHLLNILTSFYTIEMKNISFTPLFLINISYLQLANKNLKLSFDEIFHENLGADKCNQTIYKHRFLKVYQI